MSKPIRLGLEVQDIISDYKGIATCRLEAINGMVQFGVTPKVTKNNGKEEAQTFDEASLRILGPGVTKEMEIIEPSWRIELGQKVKDLTTGAIGIAVERVIFLNGCVYYDIRLPYNAERGGRPTALVLPQEILTVEDATTVLPKRLEGPPPGGPTRRVPSIR